MTLKLILLILACTAPYFSQGNKEKKELLMVVV